MSWSKIQGVGATAAGGTTSLSVTLSSTVAIGDVVAVGFTSYRGSSSVTFGVSDTHSNSYSAADGLEGSYDSNVYCGIQYSVITTGGSSDTVTLTPSAGSYLTMAAYDYQNTSGTISLDGHNSTTNAGSNAPAAGSCNVTGSGPDLAIGVTDQYNEAYSVTAGSGFTMEYSQDQVSYWGFYEDQLNVTSTVNPGFSFLGTAAWTCIGATFKVTAAAAAVLLPPYRFDRNHRQAYWN
jgi:hypothetical protein